MGTDAHGIRRSMLGTDWDLITGQKREYDERLFRWKKSLIKEWKEKVKWKRKEVWAWLAQWSIFRSEMGLNRYEGRRDRLHESLSWSKLRKNFGREVSRSAFGSGGVWGSFSKNDSVRWKRHKNMESYQKSQRDKNSITKIENIWRRKQEQRDKMQKMVRMSGLLNYIDDIDWETRWQVN